MNEKVTISGTHIGNYKDADVVRVIFMYSSLSHIPNEIFDKFENLRVLDAPSSNLQTIGELRNCRNLLIFDVSNNKLLEIPGRSITNCFSLQSIEASFNLISALEPGLLMKFKYLVNLNLIGNQIKELKDGALYRANNNQHASFYFSYNPLQKIEGNLNATVSFSSLNFLECNLISIDPSFLDGFTGQIGELDFRGNRCINEKFKNVNSGNIGRVRESLRKCFDNFVPSETETPTLPPATKPPATTTVTTTIPTTEPTPRPPTSNIGKLICKLDVSKKYYNCETNVKLIVIDD